MYINSKRPLLFLACLTLFLCNHAIAKDDQTWNINLKEVDIKTFINQVSEITGQNFILDPVVTGNITVISSTPLTKIEVYELLMTVLKVHGFVASPVNNGTIITRQDLAKELTQKVDKFGTASGEVIISKVIRLKHSSAQELSQILRPMVARYGFLAASDFSNSLIISDHASNVKKIEEIIAGLDETENPEIEVITLKEAWVGNVAALLQELAFVQGQKEGEKFHSLRVVANEYNNSMILKGAEKERSVVRDIITKLDQPSLETSGIQVISLQYADAADIAEILKTLISNVTLSTANNIDSKTAVNVVSNNNSNVSIQADKSLNALIVKADPGTINEIRKVVGNLDVKRTQVLIEAAIVETTGELTKQLGVQLGGGDAATDLSVGATSFTNAGVDLTKILKDLSAPGSSALGDGMTIALGSEDKFSVLVQALSKNVDANLLSTPSITTLDNQEAKILVGQNVPFITGSFSNANGGTNPFTTIERHDIGVTLKVTPHIHKGNSVRLDVEQEVSSLIESTQQASDLITNKREIKTSILAEDKQVIALGGLIQDDITKAESKVPILGDIPLLGYLFRSKNDSTVKRNLFVFLRPTVLKEHQDVSDMAQKKYSGIYELKLGNERFDKIIKEKLPESVEGIFDNNYNPSAGQCTPNKTSSLGESQQSLPVQSVTVGGIEYE